MLFAFIIYIVVSGYVLAEFAAESDKQYVLYMLFGWIILPFYLLLD